ncbi:enoyl-CoA hydratase/isomerase-like protein [Xylophilus ampelinus]|uniref:Enoyl-CoA hydratase/isomerase-like protein n=1 Tax=Xylophilus ampelinus TaxID=54067 RepID=A0A318SKS7_9BURK|nr:enoyl-CoA hydratase/isomerase-like protein [Xylophilus ampelinus]
MDDFKAVEYSVEGCVACVRLDRPGTCNAFDDTVIAELTHLADAGKLATMLRTIAECPKPTVARVQGDVYAGGMGLVAACDMAVSVDTALLKALTAVGPVAVGACKELIVDVNGRAIDYAPVARTVEGNRRHPRQRRRPRGCAGLPAEAQTVLAGLMNRPPSSRTACRCANPLAGGHPGGPAKPAPRDEAWPMPIAMRAPSAEETWCE